MLVQVAQLDIKYIFIMATLLLFIISGCAEKIDIANEKEKLLNADREFSKMSVKSGRAKAFEAYVDEDAVMYRDNAHPLKGKVRIVEMLNQNNSGTLKWEPFKAEIAASADFGYTLGKWIFTTVDNDGNEQKGYGYYCSIWKKQNDGSWKWVYDGGVKSPPHDK